MKINVVGTSGCGKSTLSKQLSDALDIAYISLDQLFWKPNWEQSTDKEFIDKLQTAIDQNVCWVIDGNYSRTIPVKWTAIDVVIWLDYSFARVLYQATSRALYNSWHKQELWPNTNNRESFRRLFSQDSIVWWTLKTFHRTRKKYQCLSRDSQYDHIKFIRLSKPIPLDACLALINRHAS